MNNADMPAMPGQPHDTQGSACGEMWTGLTKLEYLAAHAPPAPDRYMPDSYPTTRESEWRYAYAVAMLNKLERTND